jgi:hypothetical protein
MLRAIAARAVTRHEEQTAPVAAPGNSGARRAGRQGALRLQAVSRGNDAIDPTAQERLPPRLVGPV